MPCVASEISPGRRSAPPPRMLVREALLCGARNGLMLARLSLGLNRLLSRVMSMRSWILSGGRRDWAHLASALLPLPGGPYKSRLCRPAIAIVIARFAKFWPIISSKMGVFVSVSVFFTTGLRGIIGAIFFKQSHNSCRFLMGIMFASSCSSWASLAFSAGI